jgi:hypothetical protein
MCIFDPSIHPSIHQIVCSGLLSQGPVMLSAERGNFRDFASFLRCVEAALHVTCPGKRDSVRG